MVRARRSRADRPPLGDDLERLALAGPAGTARELAEARQEDRRWQERWKAAGERLRGAESPASPPGPRPPPRRRCPGRVSHGPWRARAVPSLESERASGFGKSPDAPQCPRPLPVSILRRTPRRPRSISFAPEAGGVLPNLGHSPPLGAFFLAEPSPIDQESPPDVAGIDHGMGSGAQTSSADALFVSESSQAVAVEELPPPAPEESPTTPAPADPPRARTKPAAFGDWKVTTLPPRPKRGSIGLRRDSSPPDRPGKGRSRSIALPARLRHGPDRVADGHLCRSGRGRATSRQGRARTGRRDSEAREDPGHAHAGASRDPPRLGGDGTGTLSYPGGRGPS